MRKAPVLRKSGFRTRSLLCVPIRDSSSSKESAERCIGCIQALNKLRHAAYSLTTH